MNTIMISGNLTRDPELACGQSGKAYCRFAIAADLGASSREGADKKALFLDGVCFGAIAERLGGGTLRKGDRVAAAGRLDVDQYVNKEGQTVRKPQLIAEEVVAYPRSEAAKRPAPDADDGPTGEDDIPF